MTIAVEKGLTEIKDALIKKGYNVVSLEGCNQIVDAAIYKYLENSAGLTNSNIPYFDTTCRGVLMINATGKTIDELERILTTRLYSPLF